MNGKAMANRTHTGWILVCMFCLGGFALIAQSLLIREAQVLLFGNELSWGILFSCWFVGVAVGASVGGRAAARTKRPTSTFALAAIAVALILPADLYLLRGARFWFALGAGEYIPLPQMMLVSAAAAVPVSFFIGFLFPVACAALTQKHADTAAGGGIGWVYLAEAAGSLTGGALFSFVLIVLLNPVTMVLAVGAVTLASVSGLMFASGARDKGALTIGGTSAAIAAAFLVIISLGASERLNRASVETRWQSFTHGQTLIESRDSKYQNIALGRLGPQYSLYTNGQVDTDFPDDAEFAITAHFYLCQHPRPKRVLLVGGGIEGMLKEILRHQPEHVDYVTLDPVVDEILAEHISPKDREALANPRVSVHYLDARYFIKTRAAGDRAQTYDVIILNAPEPSSAQVARFYTREFFEEVRRLLASDGVIGFQMTSTVGYMNPEVGAYLGSVYWALADVFDDTLVTWGTPAYILASPGKGVLAKDGELLAERYRERDIRSPHFDPTWFLGASDLLNADKVAQTRNDLERLRPKYINTDARPIAYLYHMQLWEKTAGGVRASILPALERVRSWWVAVAFILSAGGWFVWSARRRRRGLAAAGILWSIATTGFAAMAIEIALLFAFQSLYGYVYQRIGLIVGIFMFGLVVGSWQMNRRLAGPRFAALIAIDSALVLLAAAYPFILEGLARISAQAGVATVVEVATMALVLVVGLLGGSAFPLAARLFIVVSPKTRDQAAGNLTGRTAGSLDAADHIGACFGSLATGIVLIPVLGMAAACWLIAALKASSVIALICLARRSES